METMCFNYFFLWHVYVWVSASLVNFNSDNFISSSSLGWSSPCVCARVSSRRTIPKCRSTELKTESASHHTHMDGLFFLSLSLLLTVSLSHTHKLRQLSPPFELLLPQQLCKFPTPHTYINTQTSHISIKLDTLVGLKLPLLSYYLVF